ncbi:MAG: site-2 protease family protein [candidate division Zixibacteria bacterium]|nr:site-2 protease family protein [candidate division Zixibacteria bacterium]
MLAVDLDSRSSKKKERIPILNIVLFIVTFISATLVQAQSWSFEGVLTGLQFSIPLMAILLFHESGHYIASRIHKVKVSYPYFIPAPTIIGTLGAIIKSKSPFYNRRQLIDVGAAGPIAGFIVAIVVTIIGLSYSPVMPVKSDMVGITLGDSLIFNGLVALIVGNVPDGYELMLSPMAFAGWVGFFVTMLNLLPVGQLDGGHIAYALFGKRHRILSKVIVFALLPLGFLWLGWFLWAFLLLFILKTNHPPTIDDSYYLDKRRRLVGYISLAIFILTFTPVPITI